MRAAVLTVSDGVAAGTREDESGDLLARTCSPSDGYEVERRVVPDDVDEIAHALTVLAVGRSRSCSRPAAPASRRATSRRRRRRPSLERLAPGIAEAIRADAIAKTPHGLLSRGVAGVRGAALVVNLPGSTGGCRDGYAVLRPCARPCLAAVVRRGDRARADVTRLYTDEVELYDIAFTWDLEDEVSWLVERFGPSVVRVLEPGSGTGTHARGARPARAGGVRARHPRPRWSRSPARGLSEAGRARRASMLADMTDFELDARFDAARVPDRHA